MAKVTARKAARDDRRCGARRFLAEFSLLLVICLMFLRYAGVKWDDTVGFSRRVISAIFQPAVP